MNKKKTRMRRANKLRWKFKLLKSIRLVVHRTSRHIYAQIIASNNCSVLAVASTLEKNISKLVKYTGNKESAVLIGKIIAERALKIGVNNVSFDRSGFQYHGRIQALADSARRVGLNF
ncbi:MAG: 50S ribosomal protein L18 [Buchnera aphidicola (Schlechtendalia peitan)]